MPNARKFLLALAVFLLGYVVTRVACGSPRTDPAAPPPPGAAPQQER